jgi:hypothetical protein
MPEIKQNAVQVKNKIHVEVEEWVTSHITCMKDGGRTQLSALGLQLLFASICGQV